jgi:hypothetical protein
MIPSMIRPCSTFLWVGFLRRVLDYHELNKKTSEGSDIATRFPRHVASRLLRLNDGETIWRPAADIFETESDIVVQ